ncbi:class I SAM-dependent methyltransferase [Inquilinus sp. NPDC058860]|uniref:class I SAM-dependent methyltransferase n=1 Tax=Inquilinus sp. NPDC058860 TaxID=3346652 RepID=UPI0036C87F42
MDRSSNTVEYALGHSESEIQRLMLQATVLRPITERLLHAAGLRPGMRVLDLGCGAGDVSLLAAEIVGPTGVAIGIDRSAEVLTVARARAAAAGLDHVAFIETDIDDFAVGEPFDAVLGRYVLIHQPEPTETIRRAAAQLRPGGIAAFHEIALHSDCESLPPVPLWQGTARVLFDAFRMLLPHPDIAGRLIHAFAEAGLPTPRLFSESPVGGGEDSPLYAWMAESVRSGLPLIRRSGLADAEAIGIETLEDRLRQAAVAARSQLVISAQICAWSRKP